MRLWLLGLVLVVVSTTACGTDDNKGKSSDTTTAAIACSPGTIAGAGATFPANIVQQWIKDFSAKCSGA